MPDPTEPNQNSGSLDSRVGTLLQEALDAAGRVEGGLEPREATEPAGAAAAPATPASTRPNKFDTESPAAHAVDLEHSDIGQLDDDLARLTESLISNEAVSPGGAATVLPTGGITSAPLPAAIAGKTVTSAPPPAAAGLTKTDPPASSPAVPAATTAATGNVQTGTATAPAPAEAPAQRAASVPTAATPASSPRSTPSPQAAERAIHADLPTVAPQRAMPSLIKVAAGTAPMALAGLAAVSKPLLAKPRVVRDTVGWLAIWTLFLASCVWVYLLFVHKPAPPESRTSPIELVTQERPPAVASGDEAPASSEHTEPAAHAESGGEGHH